MSQSIQLLVGLGNPGPEYAGTRHNVGAHFVEQWLKQQQISLRSEKKFKGLTARITLEKDRDLRILIPTTYMNRSGEAVRDIAAFYKLEAQQILVVHDELDLPPGTARLKKGGGHGGHNGLRDIIEKIGKSFIRLRLGIDKPSHGKTVDYFLSKPAKIQREQIQNACDQAYQVLPLCLQGELEKAMQALHTPSKQ